MFLSRGSGAWRHRVRRRQRGPIWSNVDAWQRAFVTSRPSICAPEGFQGERAIKPAGYCGSAETCFPDPTVASLRQGGGSLGRRSPQCALVHPPERS